MYALGVQRVKVMLCINALLEVQLVDALHTILEVQLVDTLEVQLVDIDTCTLLEVQLVDALMHYWKCS